MLPNFGALELKLEKSLTLMEKIVFELREIKQIMREQSPSPVKVNITYEETPCPTSLNQEEKI